MKNFLLCFILVFNFLNCESNIEAPVISEPSNHVIIGEIETIQSDILDEDRDIWVSVPDSYNSEASDTTKYPVLYLLDGDAHFYSVMGMVKQLSTINGNTIVPEMIVVGIPNTDRTRDLTPTQVFEMDGDSSFVATSGGGEKFLDFMERELIPHIEKKYPATNYRTFVGHSLGGLTVANALLGRPQLFNNYVAIDPSMWWDERVLLKRAEAVFSENSFKGRALFIGVANTMPEGMSIEEVSLDTTSITDHIRSILQFAKFTENKKDNGLLFDWKYYDDDDHGSVPLITEYDALRFLFPWYAFRDIDEFYNPDSTLSDMELLNLVESHYKNTSTHFGYETLPPESLMNSLGYGLLQSDRLKKAETFFKWNVTNYPGSSNVYDSMGDCYLAQNDSIKALEYFKKALEIGTNDYSQDKIDMLMESLNIE